MEMSSWALLAGWLMTIGVAFSALGKKPLPQNIIIIADYDDEQIVALIMSAREIIGATKALSDGQSLMMLSAGSKVTTTTTTTITTTSVA